MTVMKIPPTIPIVGCAPVSVKANADDRGCLFEIFREEWAGAFKTSNGTRAVRAPES